MLPASLTSEFTGEYSFMYVSDRMTDAKSFARFLMVWESEVSDRYFTTSTISKGVDRWKFSMVEENCFQKPLDDYGGDEGRRDKWATTKKSVTCISTLGRKGLFLDSQWISQAFLWLSVDVLRKYPAQCFRRTARPSPSIGDANCIHHWMRHFRWGISLILVTRNALPQTQSSPSLGLLRSIMERWSSD